MSSNSRTASRGGKGAKGEKSHKAEKVDTGKQMEKQQTGGGDGLRSKNDDSSIQAKVQLIMDMTQRSEADVCSALHDCDNDVEKAADMLLENSNFVGEWETTIKKKKNRQPSASKVEGTEASTGDDWNENSGHTDKDKPRNKPGGLPRLHGRHNDSRGWRGREKQENERNLEDGGGRSDHRERRGRSGGSTRGPGGGRGRGGGRAGARYPPRGNRGNYSNNSKPMETWDTWDNNTANTTNRIETWDDLHTDEWSAEEYTGSLADTKVFTPSVSSDPIKEGQIADGKTGPAMDSVQQAPPPINQTMDMRSQLPQQNQLASQSPVPMVTTLNAAQTQYLNQLTQQHMNMNMNDQLKTSPYPASPAQQPYSQPQSYNASVQQSQQQYTNAQQYTSTQTNTYANSAYPAVNNSYAPEQVPSQQTVRTKTPRARVPPPSKIPSSAVEMPGDLKSIGCLDLQFGAMDIIGDSNSFDTSVTDSKYGTMNSGSMDNSTTTANSTIDLGNNAQNSSLDAYSPSKPNAQSSISSALSQSLTNTDSIPQTSEHMPTAYNTPRSSTVSTTTASAAPSGLDINKQQSDVHSYSQVSSTYNAYQAKSSSYQPQSYNSSSNYSVTQTTTSSYGTNQPNNYVNSNSAAYNQQSGGNSYQPAYSTNSYQGSTNSAAFPSMSQANSYPSNNQGYPQNTSQSVYGANTGLNNSSSYGNTTSNSAAQYNSYNAANNHKLVKDSAYDSNQTSISSSTPSTTSSVNVSSTSLSLTQTTATGTKPATTLAKNSSSVVSNIPPGVAPVMSTPYIMSQGIPYFQQPVYTYEDMQLIQQRLPPHMTTPFYDMSYQTPTTLTAVRDGTLATYSMSDGRFTRTDNNASPVPSTLSQQTSTLTQGHQAQPMLPQTAGPYFFAPWQPSYQISAVYSQMPTATNAHGTSNSNQYAKPGTYGSGYGSGYDALTPSQDYTKSGYVGNTQAQNKGSAGNSASTGSSGNDLSAMYGKTHTALGKVNSYDKQGFHSGTPPPFTGALHGNQNAGLAPSGTGYGPQMFIPAAMAPHQQHHSTPLMHQPLHQMEVRHPGRRMDSSNTGGQRSQSSNPSKTGAKPTYPTGYWNQS